MESQSKYVVRSFRMPADLADWMKFEADKELRSINSFLIVLLSRERLLREREAVREVSA